MAKTESSVVEPVDGARAGKEPKVKKEKERSVLVGRVKKAIKKTKRKLSDEKFEKELKRTISFLEELQARMDKAEQAAGSGKAKSDKKSGRKPAAESTKAAEKADSGNGAAVRPARGKKGGHKKTTGRPAKKAARPAAS